MGLNSEIASAVNWDAPCVDTSDSLRVVIQKMTKSMASAVIVRDGEKVLGVITDTDIAESIDRGKDLDATKVPQVMTACELMLDQEVKSPCLQLDCTITVANAIGVMARAGVHNIMVSGEGSEVGIAALRNLLKLVVS